MTSVPRGTCGGREHFDLDCGTGGAAADADGGAGERYAKGACSR